MVLNKINVNNLRTFLNKIDVRILNNVLSKRTHFTYVPDVKTTIPGKWKFNKQVIILYILLYIQNIVFIRKYNFEFNVSIRSVSGDV